MVYSLRIRLYEKSNKKLFIKEKKKERKKTCCREIRLYKWSCQVIRLGDLSLSVYFSYFISLMIFLSFFLTICCCTVVHFHCDCESCGDSARWKMFKYEGYDRIGNETSQLRTTDADWQMASPPSGVTRCEIFYLFLLLLFFLFKCLARKGTGCESTKFL